MTSDLAVHIIRDGSSRSRSRGRGDSTRFAIPVTVTITFIFTITYFKLSLIDRLLNLVFFSCVHTTVLPMIFISLKYSIFLKLMNLC